MSGPAWHCSRLLSVLTFLLLQLGHQSCAAFEICNVNERFGFQFNNSACFIWYHEKLSWYRAKMLCREQGGVLAPLTTQEVNDFVFESLILPDFLKLDLDEILRRFFVSREEPPEDHNERAWKRYIEGYVWFGGIRVAPTSPDWIWLIDGPLDFTSWGGGYNNSDWMCLSGRPGFEHLPVVFHLGMFWYDTHCLEPLPFVCEFPLSWRDRDKGMAVAKLMPSEKNSSAGTSSKIFLLSAPSVLLALLSTRVVWTLIRI